MRRLFRESSGSHTEDWTRGLAYDRVSVGPETAHAAVLSTAPMTRRSAPTEFAYEQTVSGASPSSIQTVVLRAPAVTCSRSISARIFPSIWSLRSEENTTFKLGSRRGTA